MQLASINKMTRIFLLIGLYLIFMLVGEVESGGQVSVTFKRYRNPSHRKWNGKCCDLRIWGRCRKCDTYFKICLTDIPRPTSMKRCSFANIRTSKMGHDNIYMRLSTQRSFTSFTGNVGLYVESWDWDMITNDDLVDRMSTTLYVRKPDPNGQSSSVYPRTLRGRHASMNVEFKVYCLHNYYGPSCTKFCKPRNDRYGHYRCDMNGNIVCHAQWFGSRCDTKCVEYDDDHHGHFKCDSSGNRACRSGWYGKRCNKYCLPFDDQRGHYICTSEGEKICRTSWHGPGCKRYCSPKNDNTHGHYSCDTDGNKVCRPGWYGFSCLKYCSPNRRMSCTKDGNKVCNTGWYGENCDRHCIEYDDHVHGHYKCQADGKKICLPNWAEPHCKKCKKGYYPPDCTPRCEPKSSKQHGHYTCDKLNNKTCLMWWHKECKTYCVPHHDPINGHYTCGSLGRKQCMMGWYGNRCTKPCLPKDHNINSYCQGFNRTCKEGFSLPDCKQCLPGYYGRNCSLSCLKPGELNLGNIICSQQGKRTCVKWWYGDQCNVYCVPHDDDTNGHYICDKNGRKRCLVGWEVPECKLRNN